MTIREKMGVLFQLSMGEASFESYLESMNSLGKVTPRTQMEILAIILEALEKLEESPKPIK